MISKLVVAHFVGRRVAAHEMTVKLLKNGVRALKITFIWLDKASCDFLDVENM